MNEALISATRKCRGYKILGQVSIMRVEKDSIANSSYNSAATQVCKMNHGLTNHDPSEKENTKTKILTMFYNWK